MWRGRQRRDVGLLCSSTHLAQPYSSNSHWGVPSRPDDYCRDPFYWVFGIWAVSSELITNPSFNKLYLSLSKTTDRVMWEFLHRAGQDRQYLIHFFYTSFLSSCTLPFLDSHENAHLAGSCGLTIMAGQDPLVYLNSIQLNDVEKKEHDQRRKTSSQPWINQNCETLVGWLWWIHSK